MEENTEIINNRVESYQKHVCTIIDFHAETNDPTEDRGPPTKDITLKPNVLGVPD